jgi:hypothetical protein
MFIRSALLSLSALAAAKELPKDEVKGAQLYDSGIRHANNMALKQVGLVLPRHQSWLTLYTGTLGHSGSSWRIQLHAVR